MKSKNISRIGSLAVLLLTSIFFSACQPAVSPANADSSMTDGAVSASTGGQKLSPFVNAVSTSQLSDDEIDGLLYMREEEKLAYDVYVFLYETWGVQVFDNISNSEATHSESVRGLIERYSLDDPAAAMGPGEFVNADLQALYDQLTEQGSRSVEDALSVGAAIEEIDILDLEEQIAQTDKKDISRVYENLLQGSQNHLSAFVRSLSNQTRIAYSPQYLTQEEYDQIVGSTASGSQMGMSGSQNQNTPTRGTSGEVGRGSQMGGSQNQNTTSRGTSETAGRSRKGRP